MQIRIKVVFSLLLLVAVLSAGLKVILDQVVKPEFEALEKAQFQEDINHTKNLLNQESQRLETLAYDWGVWDQTYQFINGSNPDFIDSNLTDTTTHNLTIDQMFFVNLKGKVVWSQSTDRTYTALFSDAHWPDNHPLLHQASLKSNGVILTQSGPYLFGRSVIANGEDTQQHNGVLVLLRKLNVATIDTLESLNDHPTDLKVAPTPDWSVQTELLSEDDARVTAIIPLLNSADVSLHLQQNQVRKINHQATDTIMTVFLSTIAIGLIVTLMVYLFLSQHILIPIGRLNKQAEAFGLHQEINSFSFPERNDEIGLLFRTFRQMAEKILSYQNNLVREKQSLELVSLTDQLTGMSNRRYLDQILPEKVNRSDSSEWLLVMLDLDHFKQVNDRYGHDTGDQVLEQFAQLLRDHIRDQDHCVRYGGEEFMLAMPGMNPQGAKECCERIRRSVEQSRFGNPDQSLQLRVSQGFILFTQQGSFNLGQLEQYLGYADTALYAAKNNGRNCWIGIDGRNTELPSDHTEMIRQLQLGQITILREDTDPQINWP